MYDVTSRSKISHRRSPRAWFWVTVRNDQVQKNFSILTTWHTSTSYLPMVIFSQQGWIKLMRSEEKRSAFSLRVLSLGSNPSFSTYWRNSMFLGVTPLLIFKATEEVIIVAQKA